MKLRAYHLPFSKILLFKLSPLLLTALLLVSACTVGSVSRLEREALFELELGKLDDQIDFFQLETSETRFRNRIVSRDGRVYISNGNSGKLMEFTGYGDLLVLLYDPFVNPQPVLPVADNEETFTRRAISHRFNDLGEIAVTTGRGVLIEDRLRSGGDYDEELGVYLRSRILRFNAGQYVEYLGQEGIGGSPFPHIEDLQVTANDEIVVVTRTDAGRRVYWYSAQGELRWEVPISDDQLPMPDRDDLVPSLERVLPDLHEQRLYVKLDYYEQLPGEGTQLDPGDAFSQVYTIDLIEGSYQGVIDIPGHEVVERLPPDFEPVEISHLYRMIGVGPGSHLFFLSRDGSQSSELLILHKSGQVVGRRRIVVEDQPLYEFDLSVSPEGILVGLLGREDRATIAWWRTDELIGN